MKISKSIFSSVAVVVLAIASVSNGIAQTVRTVGLEAQPVSVTVPTASPKSGATGSSDNQLLTMDADTLLAAAVGSRVAVTVLVLLIHWGTFSLTDGSANSCTWVRSRPRPASDSVAATLAFFG